MINKKTLELGIVIGIAGFIFSVLANSFLIPVVPIDLSVHSIGNGIVGFIIGFFAFYYASMMSMKKGIEL